MEVFLIVVVHQEAGAPGSPYLPVGADPWGPGLFGVDDSVGPKFPGAADPGAFVPLARPEIVKK